MTVLFFHIRQEDSMHFKTTHDEGEALKVVNEGSSNKGS
jgi:hypothetical protein